MSITAGRSRQATVDTRMHAVRCLPSPGRGVLNSDQYACLAVAVQCAHTPVLERLVSIRTVALCSGCIWKKKEKEERRKQQEE